MQFYLFRSSQFVLSLWCIRLGLFIFQQFFQPWWYTNVPKGTAANTLLAVCDVCFSSWFVYFLFCLTALANHRSEEKFRGRGVCGRVKGHLRFWTRHRQTTHKPDETRLCTVHRSCRASNAPKCSSPLHGTTIFIQYWWINWLAVLLNNCE